MVGIQTSESSREVSAAIESIYLTRSLVVFNILGDKANVVGDERLTANF